MEDDTLKDLLQQKLANHESFVDDGDWAIIDERLQQGKKRKTIIAWFTASGAAAVAAAVALFFILHGTSIEGLAPSVPQHVSAQQDLSNIDIANHRVTKESGQAINEEAIKPLLATVKNPVRPVTGKPQTIEEKAPEVEKPITVVATNKEVLAEAMPSESSEKTTVDEAESKPVQENTQDISLPFLLEEQENDKPKKKEKKWALALAANQSSAISSSSDYVAPLTSIMNVMSPESAGKSPVVSTYNASPITINHHVPLSFGLTFRYYFTKHWAVESGLVYTYLATDYEDQQQNGTRQQLHYLGIPLNVAYQIINWKGFACYVSGGGMMEKGLNADYSPIGSSTESSRHESISGLQWSLNGQLGISYNFTKHFSLYAEPGLRYFFKNEEQPESIRTDHPLNFNLGFGLRTNF